MLELNRILIIGRLTHDPETRMTNAGKAVAKLNLAVNRRAWNGGADEVLYVEVIAWEKSAEFAKNYLRKGGAVFVEGRLRMEAWDDKTTGAKRSKLNIVADRLAFAESKSDPDAYPPSTRQRVNAAMSDTEGAREAAQAAQAASERARIEREGERDQEPLPF